MSRARWWADKNFAKFYNKKFFPSTYKKLFQVRGFGGEKPGDGPIWMDAVNCAGFFFCLGDDPIWMDAVNCANLRAHTHTHTLDGGGEEYLFFHGPRVKIRV